VDIRADLYSLGGTFYFLLTGLPPFTEGSAIEKLLMHQLDEPVPVTERRADVPGSVSAIVHKLLAKAPRDRFQTPGDLAEVLATLAVPDRPAPPPSPPKLTTERLVSPPSSARSSDRPVPAPPSAFPKSEMKTPYVPSRPGPATPQQPPARPPVGESKPASGASLRINRSPTPSPTPGRSGQPTPRPDDLVAASVYNWQASSGSGATPAPSETLQDKQPARHIAVLKNHTGCVVSLAFSADRDTLASGGVDGSIRLWDFTSGSKPREKAMLAKHADAVHALAFSPNNYLLASGSGGMDGTVWLWNLTGDQPRPFIALQGHKSPVDALAFSADGKMLASGGNDTTVRVWDIGQQPKARATLKGHTRPVKALAFAPDGQTLASAAQDSTVRLWSLTRMWSKERAALPHEGDVNSVAFSPDGKFLAVACQDQTVRLWDVGGTQPAEKAMLTGHQGAVRLVLITDGGSVVSVGEARQVIVWELATGNKLQEWALPRMLSTSFALTVDGRYLANGTSEGPVNVYRIAEKRSQSANLSGG
jgi:WD40 repeat protein